MAIILEVLKIILIVLVIFFVVTFTVYFFNLDMKLTSALQPWIMKMQEKAKRDRHL